MHDHILPTILQEADSLTTAAYSRLRSDILTGILKPGEKLRISALTSRYGFGPTPVREALMLLTSRSLVDRVDQRGFTVRPVTLKEFDELLKTRCWLEEIALRESIAHANAQWHEELVLAIWRLNQQERLKDGTENPEWEQLHRDFHLGLLKGCNSRFLLQTCADMFDLNTRYRYVARGFESQGRSVGDEHQSIVDSVIAGNAEQAVEQLLSHYRTTAEPLRKNLS